MYSPVMELASFDDLPVEPRLEILRGMLEALIVNNRVWLRRNPQCPPMYTVAPKYKLKVRPFGLDTWQDIKRTLMLGSGDCKDFACWRVAELREAGYPDVSPRIKVSENPQTGLVVYHIQVRQDLKLEDPSAILGMPPSISPAQAKSLIRGSDGVDGIMASMNRQNDVPAATTPIVAAEFSPPPYAPIRTLSGWESVGRFRGLELPFAGYARAHMR